MRILPLILFLLVSVNAESADYFIRDDGGTATECSGLVNAAKKADKKCAWNYFSKDIVFSATNTDTITIAKGRFTVIVRKPNIDVPLATLLASPSQYITAAKNGQKVYYNELDGKRYEIIIERR